MSAKENYKAAWSMFRLLRGGGVVEALQEVRRTYGSEIDRAVFVSWLSGANRQVFYVWVSAANWKTFVERRYEVLWGKTA